MPIASLGDSRFEYPESMGVLRLHAWHGNRIVGSYARKTGIFPITFDLDGRTTSWNRKYYKKILPI